MAEKKNTPPGMWNAEDVTEEYDITMMVVRRRARKLGVQFPCTTADAVAISASPGRSSNRFTNRGDRGRFSSE